MYRLNLLTVFKPLNREELEHAKHASAAFSTTKGRHRYMATSVISLLEMKIIISWSGWQYGNITFEDETEINVDEIRDLLDNSDDELSKD